MEKGSSDYIIIVTDEQGSKESLKVTSKKILLAPKHGDLVPIDDEGHMAYVTDIYTPAIGTILLVREESVLDRKMRTRPPGSPVTFW